MTRTSTFTVKAWTGSHADKLRLRRTAERELRREATRGERPPLTRGMLAHEIAVYRVELEMQNRTLLRAQTELETALQKARALYDSAPVGYVTTDDAGLIVAANAVARALLGADRDQLLGSSLASYFTPECRDSFEKLRSAKRRRDAPTGDVTIRRPDGSVTVVHLHSVPAGPRGQPGRHAVLVDVTPVRRLEQRLVAQQDELALLLRLRSVSEMADMIVHELSQPLQNIQNFSRGCVEQSARNALPDSVTKALAAISSQAEWAGEFVSRLRRFVAASALRADWDMNQIVSDVVSLTKPEARFRKMRVNVQLDAVRPRVSVNAVQIQQVLVNLVRNAFDAMQACKTRDRELTIESSLAGATVMVAISDRGPGLAGVDPASVFQSFYTTKPDGLGLGLAICKSIADAHGGRIDVASRPAGGATFRLFLPLAAPPRKPHR